MKKSPLHRKSSSQSQWRRDPLQWHHRPIGPLAKVISDTTLELLWPTRCAICDTPGILLCEPCFNELLFIDSWRACPRCGAPFGKIICTECSGAALEAMGRKTFPLNGAVSTVMLDELARRIVLVFKDQDEQRLSQVLAFIMARYIPPLWYEDNPVISYIPASQRAFRQRGFDHGELLAKSLAELTGLSPYSIFDRPNTSDQRQLSQSERQRNLSEKLHVKKEFIGTDPAEPAHLRRLPSAVIVVDDICTTGATIYAAASALRANGCETIYGLTFARVS